MYQKELYRVCQVSHGVRKETIMRGHPGDILARYLQEHKREINGSSVFHLPLTDQEAGRLEAAIARQPEEKRYEIQTKLRNGGLPWGYFNS